MEEGKTHDLKKARQLGVCVIMPTYNNCKTLQRVLDGIFEYAQDVIVINDGSTDDTSEILDRYSQITRIDFSQNSGKGTALQAGFVKALEQGFRYAITIDSDGQHFPSDILFFLEEIEHGEALLIGSRNMAQEGVPKKSSFGNRFSNFWFWVETGIRLADTQSGYRLYPLESLPKKFYTKKFEFEIEVIVRSAWNGVPVRNIPVDISYDADERVSHFRPFKDFTRISILNTVLVLNTFLYIKPRNAIRSMKQKGFRKFLLENVLASEEPALKKSLSIALGVFVGLAPIWGIQTVTVLFLAAIFRLNKVIAFTFSHVSMPPLIPFIIYAALLIGGWFIPSDQPLDMHRLFSFSEINNNIWQYLLGSLILATAMSAFFGVASYLLLSAFSKQKKN